MSVAEDILTDYNKYQKENSTNNNLLVIGEPRSGKNYLLSWLKEAGLRLDTTKLIELYATTPTQLGELLQFMFPNGFFEKRRSIKLLNEAVEKADRSNIANKVSVDELEELVEYVEENNPRKAADRIQKIENRESSYAVKECLQEAREKQDSIAGKMTEIQEWMVKNSDMPSKMREMYAGESNNYRFSTEVFVPISSDMPTEPVPDFFTPFAIPVDVFAKHEKMTYGLQIVHSKYFRDYRKMYDKLVEVGDTTYPDLKNAEEIQNDANIEEIHYGDGDSIEGTRVESEKNSLKSFRRDWEMFFSQGVVCSSGFEHNLRPKLKQALLEGDPDVMILYTGFLNSKAVRKFVIATFLETMRDIIENLSGDEVEQLDKKFVASMVEGQELVMKNTPDRDLLPEDKVFNHCVNEMMDKSGHFGTEFWVDVKPGYVHKILTSKSRRKVITQLDKKLVGKYVTSDEKGQIENAMNNHDYTNRNAATDSFGYSFLFSGEIPEWKVNNRVTYGHRLPCPRMTSDIPVDDISNNDWNFFTEELGYEEAGKTISFQDYQKELFEDDWDLAEKRFRQKRRREVEEEKKEEEQDQMEKSELRKTTAQQKLRTMVAEKGVPSSWRDYHRQIMEEMKSEDQLPQDFSMKQMENYTKKLREQLEAEEQQMKSEQFDFEEIEEIADHMVEQPRFVFGCTAKSSKRREVTKYIVKEYGVGKDLASDVAEDVVEESVSILQYPERFDQPIIADSHQPKVEEEEYEEWLKRRNQGTAEKSEEQDSGSNDVADAPGEEWICLCGTLNEGERSVCRNCTRSYEEVVEEE